MKNRRERTRHDDRHRGSGHDIASMPAYASRYHGDGATIGVVPSAAAARQAEPRIRDAGEDTMGMSPMEPGSSRLGALDKPCPAIGDGTRLGGPHARVTVPRGRVMRQRSPSWMVPISCRPHFPVKLASEWLSAPHRGWPQPSTGVLHSCRVPPGRVASDGRSSRSSDGWHCSAADSLSALPSVMEWTS